MAVKVDKFIVPDEFMIPVGAKATSKLKKCADSWNESEVTLLRVELPQKYHAVPPDELKSRWIILRKNKTPGFTVGGHGPAKGSRRKPFRLKHPKWYKEYLESEDWKTRRLQWLKLWDYKCAICYGDEKNSILDVHHRTYERLGKELPTDCVVLCRQCHDLFELQMKAPEDDPNHRSKTTV